MDEYLHISNINKEKNNMSKFHKLTIHYKPKEIIVSDENLTAAMNYYQQEENVQSVTSTSIDKWDLPTDPDKE